MKQLLFAISFLVFTHTLSAQAKISGIQAQLFYNENKGVNDTEAAGTLSPNVIDNPDFALWNVIIGEGAAAGYTEQTLVTVLIDCKGLSNKGQILRFTATAGKKVLLQKTQTFSVINDDAVYHQAFLLNDTGCDKITLKAEILKAGKPVSSLTKYIDFHCGE